MSDTFQNKTLLITGGTGSFGQACVDHLLKKTEVEKIIVFSRDELKQSEMRKRWPDDEESKLRYFLGDVRSRSRLLLAFKQVDIVIHAAALKQIPTCEYNPMEAVETNILGAQNVIQAAEECGVEKVVALSSDKAVNPINLYGATKLTAEKLFIAGNVLTPKFSIVRYGNVLGSRGSVLSLFLEQKKQQGKFTLTDHRMTRFWITIQNAVEFVLDRLEEMEGGEIFVPKMPSCPVYCLIDAIGGDREKVIYVGMRPGEKIHETLISQEEKRRTVETDQHFVVLPAIFFFGGKNWEQSMKEIRVLDEDAVTSNNNSWQVSPNQLKVMIEEVR